jgi:hypothetical protein
MSAELKFFLDKDCTQEIAVSALGDYILRLAPMEGLNGFTGQSHIVPIYIKNIGARAALGITAEVSNDPLGFVRLSAYDIGDLMELETYHLDIIIQIPRWTHYQIQTPHFTFDYYTLPEIDETYHNPYQDPREIADNN